MKRNFFASLTGAIGRRWQGRRNFASTRDWLVTLYDAQLRYARRWPMPGKRRVCPVHLAGETRPLYLRMGSSDGFVLEEIFVTKVYEPVTSAALGEVRQIVDLGANAGFSVRLWRREFPGARVIAVEPDPGNFAAAQRNIGPSDPHVQLVQACIAGSPGTVYLDRSAEECAFTMTDKPQGTPIPAITLPMLLEQCHGDETIDMLKVDIEGAEQGMFADCSSWITRVRSIMIELHPPYTRQMFLNDLQRQAADNAFAVRWEGITANNPLMFLVRT